MLMLMKILSNALDIYMYFPSPIGIRGAIYIYTLPSRRRDVKNQEGRYGRNREKKQSLHSFIPKR